MNDAVTESAEGSGLGRVASFYMVVSFFSSNVFLALLIPETSHFGGHWT